MAKKIVDEQPDESVSADRPGINEMMVCQVRATIRELWPDEFDIKPELTLMQGGKGRIMDEDRADQLRSLMAAKRGEINADVRADEDQSRDLVKEQVDAEWGPVDWNSPVGSENTPQPPKGRLPASPIPFLSLDELRAEWSWLRSNYRDWNNEETTGRDSEKDWKRLFYIAVGIAEANGKPIPTKASIRREAAEWRAVIKKRRRVKDWLESLGVNWDTVDTPEQALFFVFDRMQMRELRPDT